MFLRRLACSTPLLLGLACGGGGSTPNAGGPGTTPTPMAAESAEAMATAFLLAEHQQASSPALPTLVPSGDDGVYALQTAPGTPGCVSVSAPASGTVVFTFTGCLGPNGGVLSGQLSFSWKPNECTLSYQNFQASKGTQAWILNGTKTIQVNAAAKQATVSVTGMTMAFTDAAAPATNRTLAYSSNLTSDWATAGAYKLWGTFSAQQGTQTPTLGTIAAATPLTWTAGCCYPVSGTLGLRQGLAQADLAFGPACGALTLTPFSQAALTKTLAACP